MDRRDDRDYRGRRVDFGHPGSSQSLMLVDGSWRAKSRCNSCSLDVKMKPGPPTDGRDLQHDRALDAVAHGRCDGCSQLHIAIEGLEAEMAEERATAERLRAGTQTNAATNPKVSVTPASDTAKAPNPGPSRTSPHEPFKGLRSPSTAYTQRSHNPKRK